MALKEIAEAIKLLGDVVQSTRGIIKAVNDGREFLKRHHPEAGGDVRRLLRQMQRAVEGLATVTRVFAGFRFAMAGASVDLGAANQDLARLNDYLISQREKVAALKGRLRTLKADCDKVRRLRDALDARTRSHGWGTMFELFGGKTRKRSLELHSSLSNLYADDQRMIQLLESALALAERATDEVEEALGPPGTANPYNVPLAARILGIYATLFRGPVAALDGLADDLSQAGTLLTG